MAGTSERGPYLSHNRALGLERHLAAVERQAAAALAAAEARWEERFRQLEGELARVRRHNGELVRAHVAALLAVIRDHDTEGGSG